jgi:hypothetical protein
MTVVPSRKSRRSRFNCLSKQRGRVSVCDERSHPCKDGSDASPTMRVGPSEKEKQLSCRKQRGWESFLVVQSENLS